MGIKDEKKNLEVKKELANYAGAEKVHDVTILMHNRMGIRIEYNISMGEIELWISPKAGKSVNYYDRNFSNRDDHNPLFDKISLTGFSLDKFIKCDYDPFHTVVYFEDQALHILSLVDKPLLMLWSDKDYIVDFKTDKCDTIAEREDKVLAVYHPDREYVFEYAAVLGEGHGSYIHQLEVDRGRSIYARACIAKEQVLVIAGDLKGEKITETAKEFSKANIQLLIEENIKKVGDNTERGRIKFKDMPELQKLIDVNKSILYSVQDASGALRAAIKRIYYLIWVRDGGITCPYQGYSGWTEPLEKWNEFLLANPTEVYSEKPEGKFFGQLVNGKISKWQEDGAFYAVWSAFTYWTQSGDKKFISGNYLETLKQAVSWLEGYCFDTKKGLFGRYFSCETPFTGSRDHGWDNAVGKPVSKIDYTYKGSTITRSYDIYVNALMYSAYVMLSCSEEEDNKYLEKAEAMEKNMEELWSNDLPYYGLVTTNEGEEFMADPYGLDLTDYIWALSLPPFISDAFTLQAVREKLYYNMMKKPKGYFVAGYCSLLSSIDTEFFEEEKIMEAINYIAKQCYRPGKYLPMPNTIVEIVDVEDGNIYHDVRPQCFSIGAFLGAVTNLGIRRLPFGIALRSTNYIKEISRYEYLGSTTDIIYKGSGKIKSIEINGKEIKSTYQLPEVELCMNSTNTVVVEMSEEKTNETVLVASSVRLEAVESSDTAVTYSIEAFGKNELVIKNLSKAPQVFDSRGNLVEVKLTENKEYSLISFKGKGKYKVTV
jgi:hypothetical protein